MSALHRFSSQFFGCTEYVPDAQPLEMKATIVIDIPKNQDVPKMSHRGLILKSYPMIKPMVFTQKIDVGEIAYFPPELLRTEHQAVITMISRYTWHDWTNEVQFALMLDAVATRVKHLMIKRLVFTAPPVLMWRHPILKYLVELHRRFEATGTSITVCRGD